MDSSNNIVDTSNNDTSQPTESNKEDTCIKHLVCSGGGINGFLFYSVLKETNMRKLWALKDIQTYYGTSVGTIIGAMILLAKSWEDIDDYLIHRPWENVFKFDLPILFESVDRRGVYNMQHIHTILAPFILAKDKTLDMTMLEFYELTNVEYHCIVTEVNTHTQIDVSYKTHPDWKLLDAIYSSCALPIVFAPLLKDDKCYADGSIITNCAIKESIENGADPDEILAVYSFQDAEHATYIDEDSTMFDYVGKVMKNIIHLRATHIYPDVKYAYKLPTLSTNFSSIYDLSKDKERRIELIEGGKKYV
jgi:predicted acylesterase/phospholipase RssA|uniref:PNPLA domain-containing protein n=1 Tax=viral metagenome TaxID=1070528 RepID=A0A6C0INK1_9ZZZZ